MLTARDLAQRTGPVLSDGTSVRDLIDFERREVSMRVINDPEIHRLELQRVFARSWLALADESEIPNVGDFVLRRHGEDPVIVTRGTDGQINVLLNVCAHRGMEVCWADEGNQSSFKCPYHGWAFDNAGALLGAPFEREMYGDWDKSQYGLRTARVDIRHGLVFANFDQSAPALEEWLGDMLWYIDAALGGREWECVGGGPRFSLLGNWKTDCDQLAGDLYHFVGMHQAFVQLGFMPEDGFKAMIDVVKVGFPGLGHTVLSIASRRAARPAGDSAIDQTLQLNATEREGDYLFNPEAVGLLCLFPINTTTAGATLRGSDGNDYLTADVTSYQPMGLGAHEVFKLGLVEKGAPEDVKRALTRQWMMTLMMAQDDAYGFESMTRKAAVGAAGRDQTMKYPAVAGVRKPDGWPGPGEVYAGFSRDDTQWLFWQRWFEMMTADEGDDR